ncbi:MAG: serine hydrolase, partial [Sphingopyxis terrae]
MALAGCVSGAALVPTPRQAQTAPRGAVSVPIGPPVSAATPARAVNAPPNDVVDPGFRRPPSGLSDRISQLWRTFPGKTGIAV